MFRLHRVTILKINIMKMEWKRDISMISEYEVTNMYENKKKLLYNNIFKAFFSFKIDRDNFPFLCYDNFEFQEETVVISLNCDYEHDYLYYTVFRKSCLCSQ